MVTCEELQAKLDDLRANFMATNVMKTNREDWIGSAKKKEMKIIRQINALAKNIATLQEQGLPIEKQRSQLLIFRTQFNSLQDDIDKLEQQIPQINMQLGRVQQGINSTTMVMQDMGCDIADGSTDACDVYKELYSRFFSGLQNTIEHLDSLLTPRKKETIEEKLNQRESLSLNLERIETQAQIIAISADQLFNSQCVDLVDGLKLRQLSLDYLQEAQTLRQESLERDALKQIEKQVKQFTNSYESKLFSAQVGFQSIGKKLVKIGKSLDEQFQKLMPQEERSRVRKAVEQQRNETYQEYLKQRQEQSE